MVYFVKNVCTLVFVTYGGLMALMMQADEMMGDRCAWLVVTVLIIVTALQMDVGLGNLSYLIWVE